MKTYRNRLVGLGLLLASFVAHGQTEPKNLQPTQAAQWLDKDKGVVVLDVRTVAEFRTGHLKNAVNIDYTAPDFEQLVGKLDRTKRSMPTSDSTTTTAFRQSTVVPTRCTN
jgi:predicted sulfurtransferase